MLDTLSYGMGQSVERPGEGPPVYGRERELDRIAELLDPAGAGRGRALVVAGAAGAGKSTLLAAARARAGGATVLATGGIESEAELPYAALHALLHPVLDRLDGLPDVQAHALRGALGLGPDAGEHRLVVSVAVLSLLAEAAERAPVLCLVDDAHWLDAAPAQTRGFVPRRLDVDRIACVFATRDDAGDAGFDPAGLDELALGGLAPPAAAEL